MCVSFEMNILCLWEHRHVNVAVCTVALPSIAALLGEVHAHSSLFGICHSHTSMHMQRICTTVLALMHLHEYVS